MSSTVYGVGATPVAVKPILPVTKERQAAGTDSVAAAIANNMLNPKEKSDMRIQGLNELRTIALAKEQNAGTAGGVIALAAIGVSIACPPALILTVPIGFASFVFAGVKGAH